jgi:hypothetical protein
MFHRSIRPHLPVAPGKNPGFRGSAKRLMQAACLAGLTVGAAHAGPGYYVVTPYDREGLTTLELRYWTFKRPNRPEMVWPEFAIGRGINSRWTTTLVGGYFGPTKDAVELATVSWQNVVLLTQGEWPVDVALYGAYTDSVNSAYKHALEWGTLFQTDVYRTRLNLNLMFEKVTRQKSSDPTQLKYQWQVKHKVQPGWQVGLQGFGELGTWNDWRAHSAQSHRAGPAVFAQVAGQGTQVWDFQAGMFLGRTFGRSGHMFSARAAYSF